MSETAKTRELVKEYVQGFGLDVGCGNDKITPRAIGLDKIHHPCTTIVREIKDLKLFGSKQFDYVFSSHFLEHIDNPIFMLSEMKRVLKKGGYLVLYLPNPEKYTEDNPVHKILWTPEKFKEVISTKPKLKRIIFNEDSFDYSYLYVGKK